MPFLNANGIRLHYQVDGDGEPLLLLHGLGSSLLDWEFQVPAFREDYKVITVDIRGHGKYSIEQFAQDIAGLIDELDCGPVHVVGFSLGGMVALELALSHADNVRSLTVVNALPEVKVRLMTLVKRWLIINLLGMNVLSRVLAKPMLPGKELDSLRERLIERWGKNEKKPYSEAGYAVLKYSAVDRLGDLSLPLTIVSSEFDYWSLDLKKKLFANAPHIDYVIIPGAHHLPSIETPEKFNEIILDILSKKSD